MSASTDGEVEASLGLKYENTYGGFSPDGWQYEINSPATPREWFNVLFNREFATLVSQVGGGGSFRIGRTLHPVELPYRALYLRDRETGEIWSPTGAPAGGPPVDFRCIHRPDCTIIEAERSGIRCRIRLFVPAEGRTLVWTVTLRNHAAERRLLSLFTFVPLPPGRRAPDGATTRFDADVGALLAEEAGDDWLYYLATRPMPTHTTGSEEAFVGGMGRWDRPAAVSVGNLPDLPARAEPTCAALQHDLTLDQNQHWTAHLALGCEISRKLLPERIAQLVQPETVEALFEECWAFWQELVGREWLTTPDEELNLLFNIWLKRQLLFQVWTRGGDADPTLMLDSAVALSPWDPEPCREAIVRALSTADTGEEADETGDVEVQRPAKNPLFAPSLGTGPVRSSSDELFIRIARALAAYVKETGDTGFLMREVSSQRKRRSTTILAQVGTNLCRLAEETGRHGLCSFPPLPSLAGEGESVQQSMELVLAALALESMARERGLNKLADQLLSLANRLRDRVNAAAWDGNWYIVGYTPEGFRIGTHGDAQGQIHLEVQDWAVLAGVAGEERTGKCLAAAERFLDNEVGMITVWPPYDRSLPRIGRPFPEPAGVGRNGGVLTAAVIRHACALAAVGRGSHALETIRRILPTTRQHPIERSHLIPTWLPDHYLPVGAEGVAGRASVSLLTEAVPWGFIFLREYLFGVRPTGGGLALQPVIPAEWDECRMLRPFRGDEYEIVLRNPHRIQSGRVRIELDGRPVPGTLIPFVGDGRLHRVVVTLEPTDHRDRAKERSEW